MRDETITAFLDQLAARVAAPGGGATAALHAAQSAALLAMVARYSDAAKYDTDLMDHVITEADGIRNDALTLAERDAAAFGAVADAYALPKDTDEEKQARSAAIAEALAEAARPPADVVRLALLLVSLAEELRPAGNRNVITDVAAGPHAAPAAPKTAPGNKEGNQRGPNPRAAADGIAAQLSALSADPTVAGIILTTPLPGGARLPELAAAIDPAKDVDGANPVSLGRLITGLPAFAPATAEAVLRLLDHHHVELEGRHAVVVGRSAVVGKPVAHLLLDRNATVTIAHSRTRDLPAITRQADVLVVAAGRTHLIGRDHVTPGATVIDVGTNATPDGGLAGDVNPTVADVAALSPVPGGVGPVTTAVLLRHVTDAASRHAGGPARTTARSE